ncbi:F-box protein [Arachis hypogaea]|nr:F-box protein [Arachis hypogaea]
MKFLVVTDGGVGGVPIVVGGVAATKGGDDAAPMGEELQARKPMGEAEGRKGTESFEKEAAHGSTLAMVVAGLMYWERGEK